MKLLSERTYINDPNLFFIMKLKRVYIYIKRNKWNIPSRVCNLFQLGTKRDNREPKIHFALNSIKSRKEK